jgi:hypothetical protein
MDIVIVCKLNWKAEKEKIRQRSRHQNDLNNACLSSGNAQDCDMNKACPFHQGLNPIRRVQHWLMQNVFGIFREMRWSYIPPLMVYLAAGVSGFTGIIESFYVKE